MVISGLNTITTGSTLSYSSNNDLKNIGVSSIVTGTTSALSCNNVIISNHNMRVSQNYIESLTDEELEEFLNCIEIKDDEKVLDNNQNVNTKKLSLKNNYVK